MTSLDSVDIEQARKRFAADVADHEMSVLHDDGLYRHVRFGRPGTSMYSFHLVTWPGCLTINGDMGTWTFSRLADMFEFFAGKNINPGYWAEKLRGETQARRYSERAFVARVTEYFNDVRDSLQENGVDVDVLWTLLSSEVLESDVISDHREALEALSQFEGIEFYDTWEWNCTEWDVRFLWCCFAIQWGIQQYRAAQVPAATVQA